MKKLFIIAMLFIATSANAFYTTFEEDMKKIKLGIYTETDGTHEQKKEFLEKIKPTILEARRQAYVRVTSGCAVDIKNICSHAIGDIEESVKCLSNKKIQLSGACKYAVKQNFGE